MTTTAIIMMIVAMATVWGGLALALWNLSRHPEEADEAPAPEVHEA